MKRLIMEMDVYFDRQGSVHVSRLRRLKDFLGFDIPDIDSISPERENEIIEKIAGIVSRTGLGYPAYFFVSSLVPASTYFAQLYVYTAAPLLEFFGIKAYEYAAFLNKKENAQRLLDRIGKINNF
jgi:hypothetical protein